MFNGKVLSVFPSSVCSVTEGWPGLTGPSPTLIGIGAVCWGGAGACWVACAGLAGADLSRTVDPPPPVPRLLSIPRLSDVSIKTAAAMVVAFDISVAEPRGPKAVWEPMPPKAPARSAALPLWSSTTMTRKKLTTMWAIVSRMIMFSLLQRTARTRVVTKRCSTSIGNRVACGQSGRVSHPGTCSIPVFLELSGCLRRHNVVD